jgi:hypothetical protein
MAGPIQIVIVGGDFVACAARRAWNAACGRRCRGHGGQNPENCMLYTPLPPGRRRAWSNPATWSCRCGGCCAPRQRVGTVTEYRPGLEDLYLPAAEQRRAGAQLGPPGGRSRVGQPPGSCPGPGRARLLMLPTWGGDFGSGWTGRSLSPCPAPSSNSARSAARGRWLPRARGASRGHRSAADAGRPPPPLGPG